jgi:hypothetical protein
MQLIFQKHLTLIGTLFKVYVGELELETINVESDIVLRSY